MNLEEAKELLALRLYDELSPAESAALDRFLEESAEARAYARELEQGLGRCKAAAERDASDELPSDWTERLRAATREAATRRTPLRLVATFAAGLAAGLLVMSALRSERGMALPDPAVAPSSIAMASYEFALRAAPPPRATGGGAFSRR